MDILLEIATTLFFSGAQENAGFRGIQCSVKNSITGYKMEKNVDMERMYSGRRTLQAKSGLRMLT